MALEHAVFAAEVALAEAAVADDALGGVAAVLEAAAELLGRAAEEREREVQGAFAGDVVGGEGVGGGGEVVAGVDEAEGGFREVGAEGEEGAEGEDRGGGRDGEGEGWLAGGG